MEITIANLILSIIVLIVLPICIGNTICCLLKQEITLAKCFITGHVTMWAVCQLVAVPLILMKRSFIVVIALLSIIYICLVVLGIVIKNAKTGYKQIARGFGELFIKKSDSTKKKHIAGIVMFFIMLIMILTMAVISVVLQHTDADDSRFVVNAVDIYRTNRLFLTDVNSGREISSFIGDLNKDVISPWAVFIAYISKLTGIYPSIIMHTILPPVIMLMLGATYWILSKHFFEKDIFHRSIFVILALLINIYGYHSVYTAETFILIRMWQGKAVLAGVGIPVMIWMLVELYRKQSKENFILILIGNIAMCLLSSMGIIICGIMLGCYGLVYGVLKKNLKITLLLWLMCLINVSYLALSSKVNDWGNRVDDDGYKITQYGNYEQLQHLFYTIEDKENNLVIIDGGWSYDAEEVYEIIAQHNNHVTAWIITHPHPDHVGAFNTVMSEHPEIIIDDIYSIDMNYERYRETAHDYDGFEACEQYMEIISNLGNVHLLKEGDVFYVLGLEFDVIHAWDEEVDELTANLANNGSLCFIVKGKEESMLFCADAQKEVENSIIERHKDELNVDYVQLGHHGNWGLTTDFYDLINPKAVFFDVSRDIFEGEKFDAALLRDYFYERDISCYTYITSPNVIEIR